MTPGEAIRELERWGRQLSGVRKRCHFEIGKALLPTAVKYAPRSPTRTLLNRVRKTRGKTRRDPRASYRTMPGTLEKSIQADADANSVVIGVPGNSNAGSYAFKMHEGRYKTWFKRGPGTRQKGAHAKEKFIERAIRHHVENGDVRKIIEFEIKKGMPK